jgi:hypothetical protein
MKNTSKITLILFLSSFINSLYAGETNHQTKDEKYLVIEDAWIAEAPPVSKVMVAYMRFNNAGTKAIEIIRAESDLYSSIEFHETIHENAMARMIRHDTLNIPANSKLELMPGGPHMMLFNPKKRLAAGDTVNIKLTTKNNKIKTVTVPVKKAHYD